MNKEVKNLEYPEITKHCVFDGCSLKSPEECTRCEEFVKSQRLDVTKKF